MEQARLLELINKYGQTLRFDQQEQLNQGAFLYDFFSTKLSSILNQMQGEIKMLKERSFDAKMLALMIKVHKDLLDILKETIPEMPFAGAEKFVKFVLDKPFRSILENLDFLAKHHVSTTNLDFAPMNIFTHPEIKTFAELKALAEKVKVEVDKERASNRPTLTPQEIASKPSSGTLVSKL